MAPRSVRTGSRPGWARLVTLLMLAALVLASAAGFTPGLVGTGPAQAAEPAPAYQETKVLQRVFVEDGQEVVVDRRKVTVRVDRTRQLRGRERIKVSWSGAHPSAARAANPYGETGLAQEYPVVILQCRGVDDPTVPLVRQVRPQTCWTSTRLQRSRATVARTAVWRHDLYAAAAEREQRTGVDPYPAEECPEAELLSVHLTPFEAANGTRYLACSAETMPPEAAVGAAFPPAEVAAFSDLDGRGEVQFEVRTEVENESMGCSAKVRCSLVVIPIMGISCADADPECRKTGRFVSGSNNFANEGIDEAVSPAYWWSPSNWRNRFSVPLDFALPPDACDVLDPRAPTGFYGSELMSQAALQWAPAYCLREDRFKFQHNRMSDEAAFALMENGGGPAAFVTSQMTPEGGDPIGYAPTAVTGFAVGYVIDKPENAGEYPRLRLTPRLLAKLLTQSYPASDRGRQHPGMESNPLSINLDPEFVALNPGLDQVPREAAATVLSLSEPSDVVASLTEYIDSDPAARAFMAGKPDPWGMRINPSYRDLDLPVSTWPLLDTFVPQSELECLRENPAPYLTQVAAPVNSLRKIAEAVLDGWPNVQTRCDRATSTDPWKLGRVDRQGIGTRFMMGIVSLGDAARLGLRTAELQTQDTKRGTRFVGPTPASLTAAVTLGRQERRHGPFTWTQQQVRASGRAYPGTQVVYTAAKLEGLARSEAVKVAQFMRVAVTEGQRPGPGNGQLPSGYLPIIASGPTKPLYRSALEVARRVAAQRLPSAPSAPPPPGDAAPRTGGGGGGGGAVPVPPPEVETVPAAAATAQEPIATTAPVVTSPTTPLATQRISSRTAGALVPGLAFGAVLAALTSLLVQLMAHYRRPW